MIYDYAIVGAGIAGAGVAATLADTATVLLLEGEPQPGYHATGRSAAMYISTYGNPTMRALTRSSYGFFHQPPTGFSDYPLLSRRGALFIGREDQQQALDSLYREFETTTANLSRRPGDFARELTPVLKPGYVAGCFWLPDAMDIDVHALHNGYLGQFGKLGGTLKTNTRVTALERIGDHWRIGAGTDHYEAAIVINAAGAWADKVAELAGAGALNLEARRRTAVLFRPPDLVDISRWPLVMDIDEEFYFKPDAGMILASPADETPAPPADVQAEEWDVAVAIDRLERATTLSPRHLDHKWAGLRTFAPDHSPVIGFDPRIEGFFWLAGQGGSGIQTAPAISQIASALLQRNPIPSPFCEEGVTQENLDPNRFGQGQTTTQERMEPTAQENHG